jgi:hypothetical protein
MSIILQSSVGFSGEFMREVPTLEKAMIAHGLEPSKFVISKDSASPSTRHVVGTFFYDYTVFVDGEHFTLTEPNEHGVPGLFPQALHRGGRRSSAAEIATRPR